MPLKPRRPRTSPLPKVIVMALLVEVVLVVVVVMVLVMMVVAIHQRLLHAMAIEKNMFGAPRKEV